jgi:hypothetical protein
VGRGDGDDHARLARPNVADAVDDRQPVHARARLDLGGDVVKYGEGHRFERLVFQAGDGLAGETRGCRLFAWRGRARRIARLADEDDHSTLRRRGYLAAQFGNQVVSQRGLGELDTAERLGAAGHRWDEGQLIAFVEDIGGVGVLPVTSETDDRPIRREPRRRPGHDLPRLIDRRPCRHVKRLQPPAGPLAQHGEQPHADGQTSTPCVTYSAAAPIVPAAIAAMAM